MKAIKFNLSYGNERIKTLDELKDNCNIDMLLETLDNGLLVRWLTAQGKNELAEKINAIDKSDYRKTVKELLCILFEKDASVAEQTAAELFALREKEAERLESLKKLADKENEIIEQYHTGYNDTLEALKANSNDYPKLKALMVTLDKQYRGLLDLDRNRFYKEFKEGCPLVLLALMANKSLREFFFASSEEMKCVYTDVMPKKLNSTVEKNWKEIMEAVYNGRTPPEKVIKLDSPQKLKEFKENFLGRTLYPFSYTTRYEKKRIKAEKFEKDDYYCPAEIHEFIVYEKSFSLLPSHIKIFSGKTDAYWKDIEPKGKTFMIISMENGNKLRNAGANGEELTAEDINGKFIFSDGIDYMSNSDSDKLIYMEV